MHLDIETPSKNTSDVPFFATYQVDGTGPRYVAGRNNTVIVRTGQSSAPYATAPQSPLPANAVTVEDVWDKRAELIRIRDLIVSPTGYDVEVIRQKILAFLQVNEQSGSGPCVAQVLYNDPRIFAVDEGDELFGKVRFEPEHGGHFHVDHLPAFVVGTATNRAHSAGSQS